ncbi:MAG TPA: hypothetical protein VGJ08_14965 [Rhizomicrobium sp.]
MRRGIGMTAAILLMAAVAHASAGTSKTPPPVTPHTAPLPPSASAALFSDDDLLLFEVSSGGVELTDALSAYSSRAGLFLPLGELSRLLDLSIVVDPPQRRAEGWFLTPDRHFLIDLKNGRAIVDGKSSEVGPTDAVLFDDEFYVRSDLLQRLLPLMFNINKSDLALDIVTLELFPFQDRLERERRRSGLRNSNGKAETVMRIPTRYELFTPPSADLNLKGEISNRAPKRTTIWEARLGGDVIYTGLQIFAGSDNNGGRASFRTLFERKDPDGQNAGFFGATRSDAGDVYNPSLALGVASTVGRGVSTTSAPLDQASVFSTTDIRGELPLGYEVELYVNEVLRGSQAQPIRGDYEFPAVPLSYGLNVVRLVFYGPRGERREEVRRINVGSGQLHAGEWVYGFGAEQVGTPLIDVNRASSRTSGIFGTGSTRIVGTFAYGLSEEVTLNAGAAQYTPNASFDHRQHELATAGVLTSFGGLALEFDGAADNFGGVAGAIGVGGRVLDVSFVARHSEYAGGFVDELQTTDLSATAPLVRSSDLTADWAFGVPFTDVTFPFALHAQHSEFVDGGERLLGDARLSAAFGRYLFSAGWQFEQQRTATAVTTRSSLGTFDVSALVWQNWQIRADAGVGAEPSLRLNTASVLLDGTLADDNTIRLGVSHTFGTNEQTQLQARTTWLLSHFDISIDASFTPETSEARFGVELALGALFDPLQDRYRIVRPGAAAGGNVALQAFVDKSGNGTRDLDELPAKDLAIQAGNWPAKSDGDGETLITGLGDGAKARIRIDPDSIDDPYLTTPGDVIELVPHPGQVTLVEYPLESLGEVAIRMMLVREGAVLRGLSALEVQLVSNKGEVIAEGRSEFDGTVIFERLPPGIYSVRIDQEQAKRLKLSLASNVVVTVPVRGGYVGPFVADVVAAP